MAKAKILELDIVRAIAILAVLIIHATSEATVEIPWGSRSQLIYLAINKLSNYAVPVFIMLSGFVLFYRYYDSWNTRQIVSFYRKRLQYVVVPYLVWSFFYYVYGQWVIHYDLSEVKIDFLEFLNLIRWADTSYHLYFIIIIAQFYLLFPLLLTLVKKWAWFRNNLAVIGLILQAAFYAYHHWVTPFEHRSSLLVTYIGLFCLGGYMGIFYEKFTKWSHHLWWVLAGGVAFGYSFVLINIAAGYHVDFGAVVEEFVFNAYAVFMGIALLWIGRKMLTSWPKLTAVLSSFGTASFGVYLIHPALLTLWRVNYTYPSNTLAFHASTIGAFLMICTVPWLLVFAIKRWNFSWIFLGR